MPTLSSEAFACGMNPVIGDVWAQSLVLKHRANSSQNGYSGPPSLSDTNAFVGAAFGREDVFS